MRTAPAAGETAGPLDNGAMMMMNVLHTVKYDEKGWHWRPEDISRPSWPQIETSIRRLDKFHFPYVWLYLKPEPGNGHPDFEVMGGEGDYWMSGSIAGFFQRRYRNPNPNGDDEVYVWTSDQGFCDDDEFICHDIETVLRAAKYFCEAGGFEPSLSWE